MKIFYWSFLTIAFLAKMNLAYSQTIQPTIMVIPFAKESENLRSVLENNVNLKVAVSKLKEGFDNRGFTTIDFRQKLKQLNNDKTAEMDNVQDLKNTLIAASGADIYVEVDVNVNRTETGNSVTVIATANDAFSGQSLSNKTATSAKFYTENFEQLTDKAISGFIDEFLATLQSKFDQILKNGRTIVVNVGVKDGAKIALNTKLGPGKDQLSDLVEQWIEANAYHNYYHLQGASSSKMVFDDVRIPVKDANGNNYRTTKFVNELVKYLGTQGVEVEKNIIGSKIYIDIL